MRSLIYTLPGKHLSRPALFRNLIGLAGGSLILALALGGCTAGQALQAAAGLGDAATAYVEEKVIVRQEYRAKQRDTVVAEYEAEMRAADTAERDGDMKTAKTHWAAARELLDRHMPSFKKLLGKESAP